MDRYFQYEDTKDLIDDVKALARLCASGSGSTVQLKNSHTGFLKETAPMKFEQLRNIWLSGKYEIWLRGQGLNGTNQDDICKQLQPTDPRRDRQMKISTVYA